MESRDDFEARLGVLDGGVHERLGAVARDVTAAFQLFLERLGADRELVASLKEELRERDGQVMSMQAELKKYVENALSQHRPVLAQENEELVRLVRQTVEQQAGRHRASLDSVAEHVTGVCAAMAQARRNRPDVLAE
ncbi:UNVERIFIED_CONTAM: hypothetical protein ACS92_03060 [Bacillus cereus]